MISLYSDPDGKKIFSSTSEQQVNANQLKQMKNETCTMNNYDNDDNSINGLKAKINELECQVQELKSLKVQNN